MMWRLYSSNEIAAIRVMVELITVVFSNPVAIGLVFLVLCGLVDVHAVELFYHLLILTGRRCC